MESLLKKVTELMRSRKKNKRIKTIVTCLAMVVVFATTYALILPAITLDDETADMEPGIVLAQEENEQEKQPAEGPEEAENTDEPEEASNKEEDVVSDEKDEEEETTPASEDTDDTATSDDAETAEAVDDETTDDEAAENETAETLTKTYLDAEIAIVATYGADANIPEEAEFLAKKLELDNKDTEEAEKTERCRYDIGFYVDGKEVEPEATVSLRVRFLKGAFADTKGMTVVHYLDNDDPDNTETIQPKTKEDADGNVQVEFDLDSFSVVEFQSEILANDGVDAKANDTARAGKTVTVTFRANGGSGTVPTQQSVEAGETITFPEADSLTKNDYAFVGWSTKSDHDGSAGNVMEFPIYQPNETYTVTDNTTFYAIWAKTSTDAVFYIALDGVPRSEPRTVTESDAADFTWGVEIANALQEAKFYSNSSGVNSNLAAQPSADQLVAMIQDAIERKKTVTVGGIAVTGVEVQNGKVIVTSSARGALNNQELYVTWYVTKNADCGPILYDKNENDQHGNPISNNWHVDGVLLTKAKVTLYYNANAPAGAYTNLPDGSQWDKNTTVKAGNHKGNNENILTPSRTDGYIFAGWKMYTRDTDGNFTVERDIYQSGQEFTITEDTELRAQWVKDTTSLTVRKTDESGNPIDTAKFALNGKEESTANGVANFGTIELNTIYSLTETQAPDGYKLREGTIYFKETKDGENYTVTFYKDGEGTQTTKKPDWLTYELTGSNLTLTIFDERSMADITIKKIETSNPNKLLSGAEFTLYRPATDNDTDTTTITASDGQKSVVVVNNSLVSDENGTISVTDLPIGGEYYLVETKAPDGYNLLTDAIHFTVEGEGITLNTNNSAAANGYTLTVSNSAGHQLPNTGGSGTTLFTLGGLAILAGCLMTGYSMRRKQKGGCK